MLGHVRWAGRSGALRHCFLLTGGHETLKVSLCLRERPYVVLPAKNRSVWSHYVPLCTAVVVCGTSFYNLMFLHFSRIYKGPVMPIYYALIARGHVVLCEFSDVTGNFDSMARSILGGLEHRDVKITYVSGQYLFHVVVENGLVSLCVADSTFDRTIAFNYLFEIRRQLSAMRLTERARTGDRHALREEFSSVLEREMHRYSSGDQLTRLQVSASVV